MNAKHHILTLMACLTTTGAVCAPAIPRDERVEAKVEQVLRRLTLEQKVGQMTEITIDVVTDFSDRHNFRLDPAKLQQVIGHYKVGSLLNVPLSVAQTPQTWAAAIRQIQEVSLRETGVPCIYGVDQIHGTTYTLGGTLFPQGINMGATFDPDAMRRASAISAYETKACALPWTYAPVMDLMRTPLWSRVWESYGEDPLLNTRMAVASVQGFQGSDPNHIPADRVAACAKHYMAYGAPVSGKDRTPSSVTMRELREKYFPPFRECIRNGALTLMVNSSVNDGMPFHCNHELLTNWVKRDLEWDGMIVTDWADINNICTRDHVAATKKDAICLAINAGIDMMMVPYELSACDDLLALVREGRIPMERIDDAVRRVLRLKVRLGLFDRPCYNPADFPLFGSQQHAAEALRTAVESIVLLKNEGATLPLAPGKRILLTGPNADSMRTLNGGWSYSWQGDKADECATQYNTIRRALATVYDVVYEPAVVYSPKKDDWATDSVVGGAGFRPHAGDVGFRPRAGAATSGIDRAVSAAASVDAIVCCIGENSYCETPGNTASLDLSDNQKALVRALAATGKPIVLVLNEGRPRLIGDIEPLAAAVVHTMLPGNYGGDALALLLTGKENFSARLPFTYPKHPGSFATYDYKPCENIGQMDGNYNYDSVMDVQWSFGSGMSYTDFSYSNLRCCVAGDVAGDVAFQPRAGHVGFRPRAAGDVAPSPRAGVQASDDKCIFAPNDTLLVSVDVKNTGTRIGTTPVLLFVSDLVASLTPDNRRLRDFTRVALAPGETRTVTFRLPAAALSFVNQQLQDTLEPGDFRLAVADQRLIVTLE